MKSFALLFAVLLLPPTVSLPAADFYVAPNGNDASPGTKDQPFASLERARDGIRRLKSATGLPAGGIVVHVAGGIYTLNAPLTLTPEDSGTAAAPIVYAGDGSHPVIAAGRPVTSWRKAGDDLWAADLPDVKAGRWYFEQLFIDGRRATRARSPNTGYYYVDRKGGYGRDRQSGQTIDLSKRSFYALDDADLKDFAGLSGTPLHDVTLTVLWDNWISTKLRVDTVDPESRLITLTGEPSVSANSDITRGIRYYLENCRAALDAPGEWFLDRDGTLYYKPLPGEDITAEKVLAPRLTRFLVVAGDPKAGRFVENVAFRGLSFQYAECPTPPEGMPEMQSAANVPAAILADGARHVSFDDCEIAHVGGYAIQLRNGCQDCAVRHCYLHDLGAGGVHLGDTTMPGPAEQSSHLAVENNIIRSGGRVFPSGSAVLSHHCSDSSISHNDIADFYYIAVSVGWTWQYGFSPAKRNKIDSNRIGWIGQNTLSDLGGIYTLGESQGTEIAGNVIHDVNCYNYGASGIYSDQASTGIRVTDNLVYRTEVSAYNMNWASDITIENNIFALTGQHVLTKHIGPERSSANFARNLVWIDRGDIFEGAWNAPEMRTSHNLYWNASNPNVTFYGMSLAEWQATGKDAGSRVADPLFVDPQKLDFRLKDGSPAARIGFVPFDSSQAGVQSDAAWRRLAADFTPPPLPPIVPVPELPPLTLKEDFASTPIGSPPVSCRLEPVSKSQKLRTLVTVVAEPSPSGQRCLRILKKEPSGLPDWAPSLLYSPDHRRGWTHLSFDAKLHGGAQLSVSLQDRSRKGRNDLIGPTVLLKDGKLSVSGLAPLSIPEDEWLHVALDVGVGKQANGTFDLTVTLPGFAPRHFAGIKYHSPSWNDLQTLVFNSPGDVDGALYLDNIDLTNTSVR